MFVLGSLSLCGAHKETGRRLGARCLQIGSRVHPLGIRPEWWQRHTMRRPDHDEMPTDIQSGASLSHPLTRPLVRRFFVLSRSERYLQWASRLQLPGLHLHTGTPARYSPSKCCTDAIRHSNQGPRFVSPGVDAPSHRSSQFGHPKPRSVVSVCGGTLLLPVDVHSAGGCRGTVSVPRR